MFWYKFKIKNTIIKLQYFIITVHAENIFFLLIFYAENVWNILNIIIL